jgi:hypothetical protein
MKKVVFLCWVLGSVVLSPGFGQAHLPGLSDYQGFLKSKTLVVLENNLLSDFNAGIKEAMNNSWSITPFEFISRSEFNQYGRDSHYSFLMVTVASFNKDRTEASYSFLSLLRGGRGGSVVNMPDLCSLPLAYERTEDDGYSYKLEAFLRFIQSHVQLMIGSPQLIGENSLKYYNKNIFDLKGKTLYLTKEDLAPDIDTYEEIRKVYPHSFKIVTREKIAQAIAEKERDVVFLHKVGPEKTRTKARVYKILIGAADPVFYYFEYDMVRKASDDAFQLKDLKRIR